MGSIGLLKRTMSPVLGDVIVIDTPNTIHGTDNKDNAKNIIGSVVYA